MFGVFHNKNGKWALLATYNTEAAAKAEAKYLREELELDVKVFQKKA